MTYTLPLAVEKISWLYYAMNAGWNIGIVLVIWWVFVETKGKTLEEIDIIFEGVVHFESGLDVDGKKLPVLDALEVAGSRDGTEETKSVHKGDQKAEPTATASAI